MSRSRIFLCFLIVLSFAPGARATSIDAELVELTPKMVVAGSPELIRVRTPGINSVDGEWLGRKLEFFSTADHVTWFALAGVDVEAPTGPSTLRITTHKEGPQGLLQNADLSQTVEIHAAHYRTSSLTVSPKFVQPPPEALKEIEEESQIKSKIFAASAPEPLWHGNFRVPVAGPPTDSFGTRRMLNGKLATIHKGADFHAATGTPVHASNSGIVVLARPLYYEGNCVIIDHGMGMFTLSMHFSRIDVREGQHVKAGDRLGLSGATGRVTGPHLHWAVRWQGAMLDPVKLLHLNLNAVQ